jgi:hypothetical protein
MKKESTNVENSTKPKTDANTMLAEVPVELQKYLADTFKDISRVEGKLKRISQYGGSIFATFDNNRTYRMNIQLYNSEVTLD